MSHHFVIRRSGRALFAHHTLRSNTFTHACWSHRRAHSKMQTSATIVLMKLPYEGGVQESLPSKVRGLLPDHRAQMLEKRSALLGNFMLREVKRAALRECWFHTQLLFSAFFFLNKWPTDWPL